MIVVMPTNSVAAEQDIKNKVEVIWPDIKIFCPCHVLLANARAESINKEEWHSVGSISYA